MSMTRASLFVLLVTLIGCNSASQTRLSYPAAVSPPIELKTPRNSAQVIHVFVALCDNVNQGIVPVAASLGNGEDPQRNLYWGAAFGVKTFFNKSKDWQPVAINSASSKSSSVVLDRVAYKHRRANAFLIAEAYRGLYIRQATEDFLAAAAGMPGESLIVSADGNQIELHLGGSANLIAYAGHDGLMDFHLTSIPGKRDDEQRDAVILACASKSYFTDAIRRTGAKPLLWTTNLMAPEAYILSAAIEGWLNRESDEQIRSRAAKAYDQYQHCGMKSANALFATGW
jgi:hypothetical protein